jgi:hypothetical protein
MSKQPNNRFYSCCHIFQHRNHQGSYLHPLVITKSALCNLSRCPTSTSCNPLESHKVFPAISLCHQNYSSQTHVVTRSCPLQFYVVPRSAPCNPMWSLECPEMSPTIPTIPSILCYHQEYPLLSHGVTRIIPAIPCGRQKLSLAITCGHQNWPLSPEVIPYNPIWSP